MPTSRDHPKPATGSDDQRREEEGAVGENRREAGDGVSSRSTRAMNLRLPESDAKELDLIAQVQGLAVAELIRTAIRSYLDQLTDDDEFRQRSRAVLDEHMSILGRYAN